VIGSLFNYFGFVGVLSVLLWVAAWALGIAYAVRWRKMAIGRAVLALAVAAWILAGVTSAAVGRIRVDPSKVAAPKAEDPAKTKAVEALKRRAANIQFAEDSKTDALDLGGAGASEMQAVKGAPAVEDYRSRGKQQRDAGKSRDDASGDEAPEASPAVEESARFLPEADVIRANRWDRINLGLVRLTLLAAAVLVVFDYFRRFNRALDPVAPLPFSGAAVDAVIPKSRVVCLRDAGKDDGALRSFLERLVRKGETFIYLGPGDPWPAQASLPRWRAKWCRRGLDKLACDATASGGRRDFAFEAAWFNRACVTTTDAAAAEGMFDHVVRSLGGPRPREAARKTVNLVARLATPPSPATLAAIASRCEANNLRLVVVSSQAPSGETAALFDEVQR